MVWPRSRRASREPAKSVRVAPVPPATPALVPHAIDRSSAARSPGRRAPAPGSAPVRESLRPPPESRSGQWPGTCRRGDRTDPAPARPADSDSTR
ncbi:hypothetical protein N619_15595 [Ectopseudomonas oleovorans]|nr:hypothetical protein N619_15595 [Pseudomonas oleovorans]